MANEPNASARRDFLKASTAAAIAANAAIIHGAYAEGKDEIKVGLVGCGGRGSGAVFDAIQADKSVRVVALADAFAESEGGKGIPNLRQRLEKQGQKVAEDKCFSGFDAYQKLLQEDLTYVILATPPYFRPEHIEAAVKAGKNVFTEKPVAVDPPGARRVIAAGEYAAQHGLSIAAGTQRRHEKCYQETAKRVADGMIGQIVAARCYWNMNQLWFKERQSGWNDMAWMIKDWVNWAWLSGDHICEQHVHNIDVVNWFVGKHPVRAVGMGGRARRVTGDQYDYFAVDFEYDDGVHCNSYCRQVNGCDGNVTETVIGTKGLTKTQSGKCEIRDHEGNRLFTFDGRKEKQTDPYVQEHIDLIDSIRNKKGLNEANNVATSTLTAIMGRIAAYTGRVVTWEEMLSSDLTLGPEKVSWEVALLPRDIPVAGRA